MKRIFLTVLDACGVGELPDAADYGDVGACTIGHAVDACHPSLPNMAHMGLGQIAGAHYPADENAVGAFGMCREASKGKDTTTGHWEIAGVTLAKPFPTFPNGFPADFIAAFEQRIGHKVIGNKPASGTAILDELGEEHLAKRTPDCLHLRRQRVPDCLQRGDFLPRGAVRDVPHCPRDAHG